MCFEYLLKEIKGFGMTEAEQNLYSFKKSCLRRPGLLRVSEAQAVSCRKSKVFDLEHSDKERVRTAKAGFLKENQDF